MEAPMSDGILWPSNASVCCLELRWLSSSLQVLGAFRLRDLGRTDWVQGGHATTRRAEGGGAHVGRGPWRGAAETEASCQKLFLKHNR